ncbi:uncharacterized protein BDZ99DRAFT_539967 [Mytilinidion resinicola]|uniref:Zn(2)-C6 fungal-type domain-containing protein n=1 Tax=Mytilinidion resinicola TaxID=574789 RepID=A0A6A6YAC8_9PEZI|nr:uncharacterized protein BDZ99DRAFT_539967 [Mytilinidion resinicola]KAF2805518.1 hypothetical protein BDZ99DRAFT_539967 [Mytilinidion resinicola]
MNSQHMSPDLLGAPDHLSHAVTERAKEAQKGNVRNRRRKTFTGCWTCRSRHVKCDEQRPACKRCLAGKFTCRGYEARLTWVSQSHKVPLPKGNGQSRAHRRHSDQSTISTSSDSLQTAIHPPGHASDAIPQTRGAFSVFRSNEQDTGRDPRDDGGNPHSYNRVERRLRRPNFESQTPFSTSGFSDLEAGLNSLDEMPATYEAPIATGNPPRQKYDQFGGYATDFSLPGTIQTDASSKDHNSGVWFDDFAFFGLAGADQDCIAPSTLPTSETSFLSMAPDFQASNPIYSATFDPRDHQLRSQGMGHLARHLDLLPAPAQHRHLINHWVTHLCDKLMPVRSTVNPFLSVVSPMALEGSRMARDKSSSTVALFHAVCAVSTTHQANIRGGSPENSALALQHTRLSFFHLMRNIHSTDANERLASLSTLCLWLLTQFISGTPGAWREVVKVARNLLKQTGMETWTQSVSASITYQCYAAVVPFFQTQYLGYQEFPGPMKMDLMGLDVIKSLAIPSQSLALISSFNMRLLQGDVMGSAELDRLEIEFVLSTPSLTSELNTDNEDHAMVYHQSWLFYHACLLYFRCNAGRREPENEIQDLVRKCVEHIEHLDVLQMGGNPRTWIHATVAFEAGTSELRNRVRASFARRKNLAFASWDTLLLAAEEVWKIRDGTLPGRKPEPWPRILAKLPQFDVPWY